MAPAAVSERCDISEVATKLPLKSKLLANGHINGSTNGHANDHKNGEKLLKGTRKAEFLLDRNLRMGFPVVTGGQGNYLHLSDGRTVLDATSGAAVSCIGHGDQRVIDAMTRQLNTGTPYLCSSFWSSDIVEELCKELIQGTGYEMSRAYLIASGSEAMEATIKLSRQYFYESDKSTPRVNFIAREGSYHGNTIGALGISGHVARRAPYEPFLMNVHRVSACYAYRQRRAGESDESFVARKAAELEAKFRELGPETVIGFICEPVVGAALGCVPYVPGYLKAMRAVCHKHGALFILDEVMSGMGRCGTLHAWQDEGVSPDLQTIGKGLGGGYQPIAAILISQKIIDRLLEGSGQFVHGQTYQSMPIQAAAALAVQRIKREDNLIQNVQTQGAHLECMLKTLLGDHPNVGDIRGKGLFWGLEFVKDKQTKEPFDPKLNVAQRVHDAAISDPFNMTMYPGTGTVNGHTGDHIILAPTYISTTEDIELIARTAAAAVNKVFKTLGCV